MSDPNTEQQPALTREQVIEQVKRKYSGARPGTDPSLDAFKKQDAIMQFAEMGLDPKKENDGAPSDWTLMRPDLPKKLGAALARGGMEAYNGIFRFAHSIVDTVRPGSLLDSPEEQRKRDEFFAKPVSQRQYWTALPGDDMVLDALGLADKPLTFTPEAMDSIAGPAQGGIFGIIESLTEFGVEFYAGGRLMRGATSKLPFAAAGLVGRVAGGTWAAEASGAIAGYIARGAVALDKMKLTQGALQGAVKAAAFDDPYVERLSSFIAEAPPELGKALDEYTLGLASGGIETLKAGAGVLKPQASDSYGKAQLKSVLEDYLLGVPFAAAGLLYGATVKRIRKGVDLKKISQEEAAALLKEAREEHAAEIEAGATKRALKAGGGELPPDAMGGASYVQQTEDGMWQVYRRELDTGVPEGENIEGAVKALTEGEGGAAKALPAGENIEDAAKALAEGKIVADATALPEGETIEGAVKQLTDGQPTRKTKRIKDIPGPTFKTKQEAEFASGAVDMNHAAAAAAKEPIDETTMKAIRDRFKEFYKGGGKGDPDPREVAEILEQYGINAKYMQSPKDSVAFIKAMVDIAPDAAAAARRKPTTVASVIDRAKELFGKKIDPEKLEPALAKLGVELKDAPAVMTAAKAYMVLQHRQVRKLSALMDAHPGNEAVEDMLLKALQNLHDVHAAFTGANSDVARALSIPNKRTSTELVSEFGLKGQKTRSAKGPSGLAVQGEQGLEDVKAKPESGDAARTGGDTVLDGQRVAKGGAEGAEGATKGLPGDEAKALPEGGDPNVIEGEFYVIGENRLARREALDMARMLSMSDDSDVDGLMRVIAGPTMKDIETANPAIKRNLWQEFLGARVEMILSGADTQMINIISGTHRLFSNPAELAWYGVTRWDKEAMKDSWELVSGQLMSSMDAIRFAGKAFRLGRSIIDPGNGLKESNNTLKPLSMDMITSPGWDAVKTLARLPSRTLLATDEFFTQINYRAKTRMDIARNIRQRIADGSLDVNAIKPRTVPIIDVTGAEAVDASRKLGGMPAGALPANAGDAGGGAVATAAEAAQTDPLKELADRLFKASFEEGTGRGIYKAGRDWAADATYKTQLEGTPRAFQQFVNSNPIGQFFFPFVRAPANVFDFIWQSTPGLNLLNRNMQEAIEKGGQEAQRAIARSEFGSMMYGVAAFWAASGMITGKGPQDPQIRASWEKMGNKPYTMTLPSGERMSYRRGDPFFASLGIMADFWAASGDVDEHDRYSMSAALMASFAANATNKSYMSNVDTLMQALSGGDARRWQKLFGSAAHSSTVPALLNDLNSDPYEREVQSVWDAIASRAPGFSETLEPRMNILGEPIMRPAGFWNRTVNPLTLYGPIGDDFVAEELSKLGRALPDLPTHLAGGTIDLSNRKFFGADKGGKSPRTRWYELTGNPGDGATPLREVLGNLMKTDSWKNMTDDGAYKPGGMKYKLASEVIMGYRELAYAKLLQEYPSLQQAVLDEMQVEALGTAGGKEAADLKARELKGLGRLLHRNIK